LLYNIKYLLHLSLLYAQSVVKVQGRIEGLAVYTEQNSDQITIYYTDSGKGEVYAHTMSSAAKVNISLFIIFKL